VSNSDLSTRASVLLVVIIIEFIRQFVIDSMMEEDEKQFSSIPKAKISTPKPEK
jgi:hypothetical protein